MLTVDDDYVDMLIAFLHISAQLEQIGADLSQGTSKRESWQNGYSNDHQEEPSINADTFLSLLDENRSDDLSLIDANGFCQLMLELEYFETILNPYLMVDATESLKPLQGAVLEKAIESISETVENNPGGHHRKPTRGREDAISDDKQSSVSPDDLLALAQQCTSEMLQLELEKTRLNSACFVETIPLDSMPPVAR